MMRPVMVGIADCPKCRQAKAVLQERGLWPEIDYVETGSEEGRRLAAEYGRDRLPFYVFDGKAYVYTGEFMRVLEERRETSPQTPLQSGEGLSKTKSKRGGG